MTNYGKQESELNLNVFVGTGVGVNFFGAGVESESKIWTPITSGAESDFFYSCASKIDSCSGCDSRLNKIYRLLFLFNSCITIYLDYEYTSKC